MLRYVIKSESDMKTFVVLATISTAALSRALLLSLQGVVAVDEGDSAL